ncbi:hypothetical protein U1Q18_013793 [Sarracenia purpurea var. burkii]
MRVSVRREDEGLVTQGQRVEAAAPASEGGRINPHAWLKCTFTKPIYIQREEKIGTPGKVTPPSTMNMLPVTYSEESWIKYRATEVNARFAVPRSLRGIVFKATLCNQFFFMRPAVISDLKIPGQIELTLISCFPSSIAITCWLSRKLEYGDINGKIKIQYPEGSNGKELYLDW